MIRQALTCLALVCLMIAGAHAHEVRPGFLDVQETGDGAYALRFRQPIQAVGGERAMGLNLRVQIPDGCELPDEPRHTTSDGYLTERADILCPGGLNGAIGVSGLKRSITDVFVTYTERSGERRTFLLNAQNTSFQPTTAAHGVPVFLVFGVEHLLGGIDHVLFILGLMLLVRDLKRLILVASAFTIAHSITLGLTVLDVIQLPRGPVEACIALSILFLAFELTRPNAEQPSIARRHPELIAFGFGLLHGLGFAGALSDLGLPTGQVIPALALFNIGVELGQLVVIAVVGGGLALAARPAFRIEAPARALLTGVVGVGAAYFMLGALSGFA